MLDWLKGRIGAAPKDREEPVGAEPPPKRQMSGKYRLLYKYLDERYASTVVLTFAEIEDLLGFTLPEQARCQQEWWAKAGTNAQESDYSDSWRLAGRTAKPNLLAQIVVFERAS